MHSAGVHLSSLSVRDELAAEFYTDHVHSSRGAMNTPKVTCVKNLNARKGEAWGISS